jgi:CheY-like chemotaxis protein
VPTQGVEGLEQKLIAVLDDDEDVLAAMRLSLEGLGARVFAASDDLYFIARLTSLGEAPDLIMLDFDLGDHTAERTLHILRARFGPGTPMIVVTGDKSRQGLERIDQRIPVISKPLTSAHLHTIADVLTDSIPFSMDIFS